MALADKILVIDIKLKKVKGEVIETISKNLKFSINYSNPGILTTHKEQIHIDCSSTASVRLDSFELNIV